MRWSLALVLLLALLAGGLSALLFYPRVVTRWSERSMSRPERMKEIARRLAIYCNSVGTTLQSERFGTGWLPADVRALGPEYATLSPDGATLGFGGGFHGASLGLTRVADGGPGAWVLSFESEDDWTPAARVTLIASDRLPRAAVLERLARNEAEAARAATGRSAVFAAADRVRFLLAFGTRADVLAAAQEARAKLADRVGAQYLAAVVRAGLDDKSAAAADFTAWVRAHPSLGTETILASYLAGEGLTAQAAAAVRAALVQPVVDPPPGSDVIWNCAALGATIAATAFALRDGALTLAACDRFEPAMAKCDDPGVGPLFASLRAGASALQAGRALPRADAGGDGFAPPLDFDRELLGRDGVRSALAAAAARNP